MQKSLKIRVLRGNKSQQKRNHLIWGGEGVLFNPQIYLLLAITIRPSCKKYCEAVLPRKERKTLGGR